MFKCRLILAYYGDTAFSSALTLRARRRSASPSLNTFFYFVFFWQKLWGTKGQTAASSDTQGQPDTCGSINALRRISTLRCFPSDCNANRLQVVMHPVLRSRAHLHSCVMVNISAVHSNARSIKCWVRFQ